MRPADIEDALNPRMAGSTEGMTLQVLAQIRDSLTALTRDVRSANEATADVRERVIRLEENNRRLVEVEEKQKITDGKVALLMREKDNRDGARGAFHLIKEWSPFIAMLFSAACAAWLYGRSLGITPAPPVAPAHVEATIQPDDHTIQGKIGGKP